MVTENKRKNTDYSNSAVNLNNNDTVRDLIARYISATNNVITTQEIIDEHIPAQLRLELATFQKDVQALYSELTLAIDTHGSYQDLGRGAYGIKQRKVSKSYNPHLFEEYFPEFAPAIIIKAIDTVKLNGLIKGGLVSEDGLKRASILEEKESFAYVIRV